MKDIEFEAKIIEKGENEKGKFVVLEPNKFYPDGKGGQIGDRGFIGNAKVLSSEGNNGKTLLYTDKFPEKEEVFCKIDGERRHTISALHTAQHILSAVLEDRFGVKTEAFHMSESTCTIDVEPASVSAETLEKAEDIANEIVFANLPVKKYYANKEETEKMNLRSKHEVSGKIRIVEIPDVDISMCGGTHVDSTGEIGLIKIVKKEKVKKHYLRLYFTAEKRTLSYLRELSNIVNSVSETLTCGVSELPEKINKMLSEIKSLKKENKNLKLNALKNIVSELSAETGTFSQKEIDFEKGDFMTLLAMLSREDGGKTFIVFSKKSNAMGIACGKNCTFDLKENLSELFNKFGGKGIVKNAFLFAQFDSKENFESALEFARAKLKNHG